MCLFHPFPPSGTAQSFPVWPASTWARASESEANAGAAHNAMRCAPQPLPVEPGMLNRALRGAGSALDWRCLRTWCSWRAASRCDLGCEDRAGWEPVVSRRETGPDPGRCALVTRSSTPSEPRPSLRPWPPCSPRTPICRAWPGRSAPGPAPSRASASRVKRSPRGPGRPSEGGAPALRGLHLDGLWGGGD